MKCSPETNEKNRLGHLGNKYPKDKYPNIIKPPGYGLKTAIIQSRPSHIIPTKEGEIYAIKSLRHFCREFNLDRRTMMRVIKGEKKSHKGFMPRKMTEEEIIKYTPLLQGEIFWIRINNP